MELSKYCFVIFCCLSFSCSSNNNDEILQIGTFILNNNINAEETSEGVYVSISSKGTEPYDLSNVNIKYKGYYLDKEVFDTTPGDKPVNINTTALVNGLRQGLKLFGSGGKGTIIIPSSLGYAKNPPRGVRKNAILVYDIELF